MKKTKLLIVADTYYPKVDGTLKFVEEFIKRAQDSFDISLLVPALGKKKNSLKTTFISTSKLFSLSAYPSMKFSWMNFKKIKEAVKDTDLVFAQGPAFISYFALRYAQRYKKKSVVYLHILPWELLAKFFPLVLSKIVPKIAYFLAVQAFNKASLVLVPYQELKEKMKERTKANLVVAKLGVDIDLFHPATDKSEMKVKLGLPREAKVVGYVGRISKEKNIPILLEAFKKLPNQNNLQLLLVGDGPDHEKEECQKLKNCHITGFVDNVQDYLQAMDVFVMPSLIETTSLATLEAMATALPVISTKVGFIQNYLVKNHNGIFFPKNNANILAAKIEKLLYDKNWRERLGENARKTIAYSFSWERSINKIKRVLLQVYYQD